MDDVEKVKQKIDIVDLIESYVPLKKAGRNFKAPCPFHNEKSPSFVVSPDRQIWHCFGCSKGGDVFTFVEEYEKTTFSDALKFLAQKAGVTLTTSVARSEAEKKRDKIYSLNALSAQYYEYILFSHPVGKQARKYVLEDRHQPEALLHTFGVGYAPGNGNALVQFLLKKKYTPQDLVEAGLAIQQGGRIIDFFRHRIMFPITDPRGNIIAFSGRSLEKEQMPKYVNTKETAVYKKGETVFGLNLARDEIKKQGAVIIMEGEFDVISAHREGIGNVVAVKGTALTPEQIELLRRYAQKLVFCFDTDPAGTAAQRRSIQLIENAGIVASVIVLPHGKDPDELLTSDPVEFKKAVKKDVHIYDFIIDSAISQFDPKTVDGKREILLKTVPFLAAIDNEVIKEHYVKRLADSLSSSPDSVMRQVQKEKEPVRKKQEEAQDTKKTREEVLPQYLFSLLLSSKQLVEDVRRVDGLLDGVLIANPSYSRLFTMLKKEVERAGFNLEDFVKTIPAELMEAYDIAFLAPISELDEKQYVSELQKITLELKTTSIKKRLLEISKHLSEEADSTREEELQKEVQALTSKLKA